MKNENFDYRQLAMFYPMIFDWLTTKTLGGYVSKSFLQEYEKNLWSPVRNIMKLAKDKEDKTELDKEILSCCYTGPLFRIHTYNERKKGHIYPIGYYQSWAKEEGLEAISRIGGEVLLICGYATQDTFAIDTFELLCFIIKNCAMNISDRYRNPRLLLKYEEEHEVVMPMQKDNIQNVMHVDSKEISKWRTCANCVPINKWYRSNMK